MLLLRVPVALCFMCWGGQMSEKLTKLSKTGNLMHMSRINRLIILVPIAQIREIGHISDSTMAGCVIGPKLREVSCMCKCWGTHYQSSFVRPAKALPWMCVSLKKSPMRVVLTFKHATEKSTDANLYENKLFWHPLWPKTWLTKTSN